jgi:DNA-binding CsgD family transcriptional regulator
MKKFNIDVENLLFLPGKVNVYWKDINSIYMGCNDVLAEVVELASRHDSVGCIDHDFPMQKQEALIFRQEDYKVITEKSPKHFLHQVTVHNRRIQLSTFKSPLMDHDGKIVGLLGLSFHIGEYDLRKNLPTISDANVPIKNWVKESDTCELSSRQLESLYWLTKGMTIKQIGKTMNLSPRTIESYLETIKTKLNCFCRTELIQRALQIPAIKNRL